MDRSRTSLELLAHFDSPPIEHAESPPYVVAPRGVAWVVKWSAALGVLFFASCFLLQLAYCVAAERAVRQAALAGVLEATLPRATRETVVETIERRLLNKTTLAGRPQIAIQHNDAPIHRVFRFADNDRVSVTLSIPTDAVLPAWLNAVTFPCGIARIEARAERRIPGRQVQTLP